ncbi:MAG: Rieske (2Fe-2S) protein [Nitrososphaerales archaeon]
MKEPSENYVRVAKTSELKEGQLKSVEIENGRVIVLANVEGTYYAMGGICHHEEWDLSEGTLEGNHIICAGHGANWDLSTGTAEFDEPLKPEPLFGVKVDGEDILVTKEPISK